MEPGRTDPREGVRAGVHVADEVDGGGVGLFRRPLVRERKAVKRAWVEERRSGVRGTCSGGGDMRPGGAGCRGSRWMRAASALQREKPGNEDYEGGASASSLSWVLCGDGAGLAVPIGLP